MHDPYADLGDQLRNIGVDIQVVCHDYLPTPLMIHDLTSACNVRKVISVEIDGSPHIGHHNSATGDYGGVHNDVF